MHIYQFYPILSFIIRQNNDIDFIALKCNTIISKTYHKEYAMKLQTFGFIGLGLIGGSIAKTIRKINPDARLLAYDSNQEMTKNAVRDGIINTDVCEINASFHDCDMIFLCAPVSINNENLKKLAPFISESAILTDVGSVKAPIHETIQALGLERQFIGGHPMAGSEKTGFANANPLILENAYYIMTPTSQTPSEAIDAYRELVTAMGAIPLLLDCREHDYVTAAVSHVPHVIAAALVNLVHDHDTKEGTMKQVAAGGFKDITRIASSSPAMWEAICLSNTDNIVRLLDDYIASLSEISSAIKARTKGFAYRLFEESKEYRDSFATQSVGPIKKIYGCYVDIPDETGALATIALILANKRISIKNIGIVHNREFEEGVLHVEFYDQPSLDSAVLLLRSLQYIVHERK